jgi:Leu/Phe-tRNA-protein transferase
VTQEEIYYLTIDDVLDPNLMYSYIYPNTQFHLYWSDDWSEDFYIESAYAGFISTCLNVSGSEILLPEIQTHYAVLDWKNLIISKKVKKILESEAFLNTDYYIRLNGSLDNIVCKIANYHKDNWLSGKYAELLHKLAVHNDEKRDFQIITVELCDSADDETIAGEIGYIIGATYTSLTGFCDRNNKKYNNFGKLQLVLLAKTLQYHGYHFWNLGHPYMDYKVKLGACITPRQDFLKKWLSSRDQKPTQKLSSECRFDYRFYRELFR